MSERKVQIEEVETIVIVAPDPDKTLVFEREDDEFVDTENRQNTLTESMVTTLLNSGVAKMVEHSKRQRTLFDLSLEDVNEAVHQLGTHLKAFHQNAIDDGANKLEISVNLSWRSYQTVKVVDPPEPVQMEA